MIKKSKRFSLNIISVFIILLCLLLSCVGITNAWFTSSHREGIQVVVSIGDLKLSLYQEINGNNVKILNNDENNEAEIKQYLQLDSPINASDKTNLILTLANEDKGSTSMYVRFRFELFARGVESNEEIPVTISDFQTASDTQNGLKYDVETDYYYYVNNSGANVPLDRGESVLLMKYFTVNYSEFVNSSGDMIVINSNSVFIKLIIEASVSSNFI